MRLRLVICLLLAAATAAVYWRVLGFEFTNYDDWDYVTRNPQVQAGLTWETIKWAFTTGAASNWHPITWLSHALDCQLYGLEPWGHHLTSLVIHIANTVLLFLVLDTMTRCTWRSAFVAAAFALHPLHVESVAWVAERKDVLSTLFWLLTMWAYARYVEANVGANVGAGHAHVGAGYAIPPPRNSHHSRLRYALVVLLFALGLMTKPMLVTLPLALLLLDYWPLGRLDALIAKGKSLRYAVRTLVIEKWPLLALSAASAVVTVVFQQLGGAVRPLVDFPLGIRAANAVASYVGYVGKMLWPSHLAIFYPHPGPTIPGWLIVSSIAQLALITYLALREGRRLPWLAVGWLWYAITLLPVVGLVQVGNQAMADRYSYVTLIGLFIILAWGVPGLLGGRARWAPSALAGAAVAAMGWAAYVQAGYWRSSEVVFRRALAVTKDNAVTHVNLGTALGEKGRYDEAVEHWRAALEIQPNNLDALSNLGSVLALRGDTEEARGYLERALRMNPNLAEAENALGIALIKRGDIAGAVRHFERAVQLAPANRSFRANRDRARRMLRSDPSP